MVLKPGSPVHRTLTEGPAAAEAAASPSVSDIQSILAKSGASMRPMFAAPDGGPSIQNEMAATRGSGGDDLSRYFHVAAPESQLDCLANELRSHPSVDAAYVKPAGEPPVMAISRARTMQFGQPAAPHAAAASPDWSPGQGYLDAAPVDVDARFAWTKPGGIGEGVQIIDCEWNWNLGHEDLRINKRGVVFGTAGGDDDHGTAVWGEIGGDRNLFGVTGIAANASLGAASFANSPTAQVIMGAANNLRAGDIILLEIHRPGPNGNGQGQFGYIGVEWWPDDLAAIRYAVARGIIVVEAAGNGSQDLDDPIYDGRPPNFPATWVNPFNPTNPTSGAVLVGAGNPPKGTHGRDEHPSWHEPYVDRARCGFSESRPPDRLSGLGLGSDFDRLWGPAARNRQRKVVHERIQWDVERFANHHGNLGLPSRNSKSGRPACADTGPSGSVAAQFRLAATGCRWSPGDPAHRQSPQSQAVDRRRGGNGLETN